MVGPGLGPRMRLGPRTRAKELMSDGSQLRSSAHGFDRNERRAINAIMGVLAWFPMSIYVGPCPPLGTSCSTCYLSRSHTSHCITTISCYQTRQGLKPADLHVTPIPTEASITRSPHRRTRNKYFQVVSAMASPGQIQGSKGPWDHGDARPDSGDYPSGAAMRQSHSDRLDARMQSPSINMLSLRTPTWIPQDSVYLVANPPVAQSRMPRPRYTSLPNKYRLNLILL